MLRSKKPIFKYSDKFLDSISLLMKIAGISIFPFVVMRESYLTEIPYWISKRKKTMNHETIHFQQQLELLVIPFYILYVLEWVVKSIIYMSFKKGYYNISFEREAYDNDENYTYLEERKRYSWFKRIIN